MACLPLVEKGKSKKANKELKDAIECSPKVADELLKKRHRKPKDFKEDCVTVGDWDQAYDYWEIYMDYWDEEALECLRKGRGEKEER